MSNYQTKEQNREFDRKIQQRIEWNEVVQSELLAFRALQSHGDRLGTYIPLIIEEELLRRKAFLKELLSHY